MMHNLALQLDPPDIKSVRQIHLLDLPLKESADGLVEILTSKVTASLYLCLSQFKVPYYIVPFLIKMYCLFFIIHLIQENSALSYKVPYMLYCLCTKLEMKTFCRTMLVLKHQICYKAVSSKCIDLK